MCWASPAGRCPVTKEFLWCRLTQSVFSGFPALPRLPQPQGCHARKPEPSSWAVLQWLRHLRTPSPSGSPQAEHTFTRRTARRTTWARESEARLLSPRPRGGGSPSRTLPALPGAAPGWARWDWPGWRPSCGRGKGAEHRAWTVDTRRPLSLSSAWSLRVPPRCPLRPSWPPVHESSMRPVRHEELHHG